MEAATTNRNLNKFRVKFSGQEASYHVGDLRDKVRFKRVAGS